LTFDSPDLKWSETPATEATPPVAEATATDATADPPPADATTPPADAATSPDDAVAPPSAEPIPFERHKAILEAAYKERDDEKAKWSRLEWADALVTAGKTPEQVREAVTLLDSLDGDYVGTLDRLFRIADQHPELQQHVRSLAGRWLGQSGPTTQAAESDPEPQPDFVEPNTGKPVFSAERLKQWQDWQARQLEARITQRFAPLVRAHEDTQNRARQQAELDRQAATLKAEFDRYAAKPHFQDHKAEILDLIKASGWKMSIGDAYNEVLLTKVLPTANQTAKAQQLAELRTQAAASSPKASSAATVTPADVRSFNDPRLKW
jgi:hypothetical protein